MCCALLAQKLLSDWVGDQINYEDGDVEKRIWSDEEADAAAPFEPSIQNIIQQTDARELSMEGTYAPLISHSYYHSFRL